MSKILSPETYRIYVKNFESGNLLNICQKFWVWKLIEYMAKILSLETYWIYVKNFDIYFESGNLLNICQKFESRNLLNISQKFWVWKLIEYMSKILSPETYWKILSLETYWIYCKNFESRNLYGRNFELIYQKMWDLFQKILRFLTEQYWDFKYLIPFNCEQNNDIKLIYNIYP